MSQLVGMNIAHCNSGSDKLKAASTLVQKKESEVAGQVSGTKAYWVGPDADTFRTNDGRSIDNAFKELQTLINKMRGQLDSNITDQTKTSSK